MAEAVAIPQKLKQSGYTATPHTYFKRLFRCCDKVELAIVGNILDETIGAFSRPEWVRITQQQFAVWANATVDGVHKAIKRLESKKFIESRPVGRNKEYRAIIENFSVGEDRHARTLARRPLQFAESVATAEASLEFPERASALPSTLLLSPGAPRAIPLAEATRRVELHDDSPE